MIRACTFVSPFYNSLSIAKAARELIFCIPQLNAELRSFDISDEFPYYPKKKDRKLVRFLKATDTTDIFGSNRVVLNSPLDRLESDFFKPRTVLHTVTPSQRNRSLPKELFALHVSGFT